MRGATVTRSSGGCELPVGGVGGRSGGEVPETPGSCARRPRACALGVRRVEVTDGQGSPGDEVEPEDEAVVEVVFVIEQLPEDVYRIHGDPYDARSSARVLLIASLTSALRSWPATDLATALSEVELRGRRMRQRRAAEEWRANT